MDILTNPSNRDNDGLLRANVEKIVRIRLNGESNRTKDVEQNCPKVLIFWFLHDLQGFFFFFQSFPCSN